MPNDFYRNTPLKREKNYNNKSFVMPKRYCYIYCQTTGTDRQKDQVVDLFILVEDGNDLKEFYSKINPSCPIRSKASTLHEIKKNDVKNCPSLRKFMEQHDLKKLLENGSSAVVTYNWSFLQKIMHNSAPRFLNWEKMNLIDLVYYIRKIYGLKQYSTIPDAINALGISKNKYKRFNSKDYAKLVREMYNIVYNYN